MGVAFQADVARWLTPYQEVLGNKTRRRMCLAYIAGLIGPGDRKSSQYMVARSDAIPYDRLHYFIGLVCRAVPVGSDLVEPGG